MKPRDEEAGMGPLEVDSLLDKPSPSPNSVIATVGGGPTLKLAEFTFSFCGLMISYVTWGVMQELIMNTKFSPTPQVPSGMFPSS